jgi:hypothetical protein
MITDSVLGLVLGWLQSLVALLPDMPPRPAVVDGVFRIAKVADYLLPVTEIMEFMPIMLAVYGGFAVWRLVRFLWPGGG